MSINLPNLARFRKKEEAFRYFNLHYPFHATDLLAEPFLKALSRKTETDPTRSGHRAEDFPPASWLRAARHALLLTMDSVASEMGVTKASYAGLELAEETGDITLRKLEDAAEAMGCELVYAIRPKERTPFARRIFEKVYPGCEEHWWVRTRPEKLQTRALAMVARDKMLDAEFRRQEGWTERIQPENTAQMGARGTRKRPLKRRTKTTIPD